MKIYTKQGDAGQTGLIGNVRVPKDDQRISAYGTMDELNASLGMVLAEDRVPAEIRTSLGRIQNELFQVGAELATPRGRTPAVKLVTDADISRLETEIDAMEAKLAPLRNFILPGGTRVSAHLHLARTVSRRAERELVSVHRAEPQREELLRYVNRLSDHLFVCARYANFCENIVDIPWQQ